MIARSTFFAAGAAAIAVGRASSTLAADLIPLRVAVAPTDSTAQVFYAQDLGFLKAAGFDTQIINMRNTGAQIAALAGGSVDIITGSIVPAAEARHNGFDVLAVAPGNMYMGAPPSTIIVTGMNSSIKTGTDLTGKICAVNGLKDLSQVCLQAWVDGTGGDAKSLKIIEIPFPEIGNALAQGRVSAAMLPEPFSSSAIAKGLVRAIGDAMAPIGKRFMITGWYAKTSWLAENRDLGRRFAKVMLQTAKWANAHQADSALILAKYTSLAPDVIRATVRAYYGETPLTAELAQPVLDASTKYIDLPRTSAADLVWSG